ncbi:MAG: PD-(D/E)XK nuclease domain-containing protein [Bryobacterales bacterium]|nr:PD-(D/E)XK nuclease domain-containing protein [Bryobacterales bacterium]MDE0625526.1 PD-(D/E)XK nuclease domain-containing protein [Bryobacterales bacterium]
MRAGLDLTVEESGSRGRLDMAVRVAGRVYPFEFKVLEQTGPGAATAQLWERGCADGYRSLGEPVHLVAVEFSAATRNVAGLEAEVA